LSHKGDDFRALRHLKSSLQVSLLNPPNKEHTICPASQPRILRTVGMRHKDGCACLDLGMKQHLHGLLGSTGRSPLSARDARSCLVDIHPPGPDENFVSQSNFRSQPRFRAVAIVCFAGNTKSGKLPAADVPPAAKYPHLHPINEIFQQGHV
jgi:hypothetical protein